MIDGENKMLKNNEDVLKCSKMVMEHLREHVNDIIWLKDGGDESFIGNSLSQEEKIDIFNELLAFICKSGDGEVFCKSFDKLNEEARKLGREPSFEEFRKIVKDIREE